MAVNPQNRQKGKTMNIKIELYDLGDKYAVVLKENNKARVYYFYIYNGALDFIQEIVNAVSFTKHSIKIC